MDDLLPHKTHLFTPGPTPVPDSVLRAMAAPVIHHRTPEWQRVFADVLDGLAQVFGTSSPIAVFASSGTGAMESAIANLVSPGDEVVVASFGRFGERWGEIAAAYGATVHHFSGEWGKRPDPEAIAAFVNEHPAARCVFSTHSETSTGVVSDAAAIAAAIRALPSGSERILVLDAISSLGAVPVQMDEWSWDVVVSGSQKALMCPPGLAMAAVSQRARAAAADRVSRASAQPVPFYFSWEKTLTAQAKSPPSTAFTPAATLVIGMQEALRILLDEGMSAVADRHVRLGRACRAAVEALGFELFSPAHDSSSILTAFQVDDTVDADALRTTMRGWGVTIAGGQAHLKGRVLRIGHCGWVNELDLGVAIAALERAMQVHGYAVQPGAGVAAAQRSLLGAHDTATAGAPR